MLDAAAAAKWLRTQGVDKDKIFLMGGSQGGWTVLRTFTDEKWINENVKGLYRGGISLYPVCNSKGFRDDPELGPYHSPVIVFTAGRDGATPPDRCPSRVFKEAQSWTHYPDATHAFDVANRGAHTPAVDGECDRAANVLNHFQVCRSDAATFDMHKKVKEFIESLK
jgi:dienelactone hydrolase